MEKYLSSYFSKYYMYSDNGLNIFFYFVLVEPYINLSFYSGEKK